MHIRTITERADGARRVFRSPPGAATTGSVPFTFVAGRDYVVTVQAWPVTYSGETNTQNNTRQFRFIVP